MMCPNCCRSVKAGQAYCLSCGFHIDGKARDKKGALFAHPADTAEYADGFRLLDRGDTEGAFEDWLRFAKNMGPEHAEAMLNDIPPAFSEYAKTIPEYGWAEIPYELADLDRKIESLLDNGESLSQKIIVSLSEIDATNEDELLAIWDSIDEISDIYAGYCDDPDKIVRHLELMAPIADRFESAFAEVGNADASKEAAAFASFYRDLAYRIQGEGPSNRDEEDPDLYDVYDVAKRSYLKASKASDLMSDYRKRSYEKNVANYLYELFIPDRNPNL